VLVIGYIGSVLTFLSLGMLCGVRMSLLMSDHLSR
jgi:hypothetical protein